MPCSGEDIVNKKPMLAHTQDIEKIQYPVLVSDKIDGVRATVQGGIVLSRTLKPIPNKWVQEKFGIPELEGADGEMFVGDFGTTTSIVMSKDKPADDVTFKIFDRVDCSELPAINRELLLVDYKHIDGVELVSQELVEDEEQLGERIRIASELGLEGVMVKHLSGKYKHGRSTEKSRLLGKIKFMEDDEAVVIGFEELQTNQNTATVNELGRTERSNSKDGLVPAGTLGALIVFHPDWCEFKIGTGFSQAVRQEIWDNRDRYLGKFAKFQYMTHGIKDKPRHPSFKGWRDPIDT